MRGQSVSPPSAWPAQKWPWVVGIVAVFFLGLCIGVFSGGVFSGQQPATDKPAVSQSPVEPTPVQTTRSAMAKPTFSTVTMPNLVGENASIAADTLRRLGFEKVQHGSADPDDRVVLLPQNWTVSSQSPKPGTKVSTDQLVVLTCTKQR